MLRSAFELTTSYLSREPLQEVRVHPQINRQAHHRLFRHDLQWPWQFLLLCADNHCGMNPWLLLLEMRSVSYVNDTIIYENSCKRSAPNQLVFPFATETQVYKITKPFRSSSIRFQFVFDVQTLLQERVQHPYQERFHRRYLHSP